MTGCNWTNITFIQINRVKSYPENDNQGGMINQKKGQKRKRKRKKKKKVNTTTLKKKKK